MARPAQRIGLQEAIGEDLLFARVWKTFSAPQRAMVKGSYGLAMTDEELVAWDVLNGHALYDELGFVRGMDGSEHYTPGTEMEDITFIAGRRWAKSSIAGFIAAYEALCGGHQEFVGKGQLPVVLQVAQDLLTARSNLRSFILPPLQESPIGARELGDLNKTVTAEQIRLKRCLITVGPPTIKLRGQAIAIGLLDEVGFWAKDAEAANPDKEVETAIRPAQLQFPFRKIMKTSSPWTEEGILWEAVLARKEGRLGPKQIVLHSTTAAGQNPRYSESEMRSYLKQELKKDAEAFRREYLAEFAKSVSGFLSPSLLRAAVSPGLHQLPPESGRSYVATMDPAFRRDAFAFCIGHMSRGSFCLDFITSWTGTKETPLSPLVAMRAIAMICKAYGVRSVVSDQYHLESLQEIGDSVGLLVEPSPITTDMKNRMWGEVQGLLSTSQLRLLDHPLLLDQMAKMEKRLTPGGQVQYGSGGAHDDLAMVLALCVHRSLQLGERVPVKEEKGPVTHSEMFWEAQRKRGLGKTREEQTPWWA